jgi:hypothetical protein
MDATFKVRPHHDMFGQLLNILVVYKDFAIPVCHILMSGKDEVSFNHFIILIDPCIIVIDPCKL